MFWNEYVSAADKICSRKFKWLVLILIVLENKLSQIPNVGHLLMNFSKPQLFKRTFSCNASL